MIVPMSKKPKVKVETVVSIGGRRFSTPKAAAAEYVTHRICRHFNRYREKYLAQTGSDNEFFWATHAKMNRRVTPIFARLLGEAT